MESDILIKTVDLPVITKSARKRLSHLTRSILK